MKKLFNSSPPQRWFTGLVVLVFGLLLAGSVRAADLTYDADTIVTIGSENYTIISGSGATSLVVGTSSITVVVPASSTFTFRSSNKRVLNNDQNVTTICTSDYSQIALTGGISIIITPTANSTCTSGGGTGGGGGGGSGSPTPPSDTTPPTNTSVVIAGGALETDTASVTLTLAATDASMMMISN